MMSVIENDVTPVGIDKHCSGAQKTMSQTKKSVSVGFTTAEEATEQLSWRIVELIEHIKYKETQNKKSVESPSTT